jgi:hypothetical protein
MGMNWREALVVLNDAGWETDDIDAACERLAEACSDGEFEDLEIEDLETEQIADALEVDVDSEIGSALALVAIVRARSDDDAEELGRALFDLDAFVDAFESADLD